MVMGHIVGSASFKPCLSPDGHFIAIITPEQEIHILSIVDGPTAGRVIKRIVLSQTYKSFLAQINILKWSPEVVLNNEDHTSISNVNYAATWLLLSDGNTVKAISIELPDPNKRTLDNETHILKKSEILANYQTGDQFGKVVFADFVFDHRHALLFFETGIHASIISFSRPQRNDISNPKFSDSRAFSQSSDGKCCVLLLRSKGQDLITVFTAGNNPIDNPITFSPNTLDAQSVMLSPNDDRLIAVCESSTYGTKVSFFTTMGHWLKQLDITPNNFSPVLDPTLSNLGVTRYSWTKHNQESVFAVADGRKHVHIRRQQRQSLSTVPLTTFSHPEIIEGTKFPVWQEEPAHNGAASSTFTLQSTSFEAKDPDHNETQPDNSIDMLTPNPSHSLIATKLHSHRKALWLWPVQPTPNDPSPQTVLLFQNPIRQISWHPFHTSLLLILTLTPQKQPQVYLWTSPGNSPLAISIPISFASTIPPTLRWEIRWLQNATTSVGEVPLMLSCPKAFEVGMLDRRADGEVVFRSWLNQPSWGPLTLDDYGNDDDAGDDGFGALDDDREDGLLATPSKLPGRLGGGRVR